MFPYQDIIHGIEQLMAQEIPFLLSLSEEQVSTRRNRQQRTVKMLVGHLIDSASNNHQRLVRLQYAPRCGHSMPATEMGMKSAANRNFEAGILTDEPGFIDSAMSHFDQVWEGSHCKSCGRKDFCHDRIN